MRLPGDSEGCRATARQLSRAAAEVAGAGARLRPPVGLLWSGAGAQGWTGLATIQEATAQRASERVERAARAVDRFAEDLEELQAVARVLTEQAAAAGLELHDDGVVPPGVAPPCPDPAELREVEQRQEVRRRVTAQAADCLERYAAAHARLVDELGVLRGLPSQRRPDDDAGLWWAPSRWDAPSLALLAGQVAAEVRRAGPAVLRSTVATTGLGFGYGMTVDLHQGRDVDDALTKNVAVAAVGAGTAVVVVAAAPAVAVVAAGGAVGYAAVVAGGAATYAAGKAFDRWGHALPWVDEPGSTSPRRSRASSGRRLPAAQPSRERPSVEPATAG